MALDPPPDPEPCRHPDSDGGTRCVYGECRERCLWAPLSPTAHATLHATLRERFAPKPPTGPPKPLITGV